MRRCRNTGTRIVALSGIWGAGDDGSSTLLCSNALCAARNFVPVKNIKDKPMATGEAATFPGELFAVPRF